MARTSLVDELKPGERAELIDRLFKQQDGLSYISRKPIDLKVDEVEIDHIISLDRGGIDDESNWGLVLRPENRSKGTKDLQLMRYIYQFRQHKDKYLAKKKDFTLGDALHEFIKERYTLKFENSQSDAKISYKNSTGIKKLKYPLLTDEVDKKVKSFIGMLPFEILYHDTSINPRSIIDLEPMIEEFYNKNPQLFPSLAVLNSDEKDNAKIMLFDGQHKAAAQLYVRSPKLFVRVFVDADKSQIKRTNFRAHTLLAQIHFPQLISDKVGHDLFNLEFEPFLEKTDWDSQTERSFIKKQELSDEYNRYHKNWLKYRALITNDGDRHCILDYVETVSSRSKKYPISYDTMTKTFLKLLFLLPSDDKLSLTIKYREHELNNLDRLMKMYVEEVLEGKYELNQGIYKLEEKLIEDPETVHNDHLIAYRLCRSAAMIIWMGEIKNAISRLLKSRDKYYNFEWSEKRVLWAEIDESDWNIIRNMIKVIRMHKIWNQKDNKEILSSLGSTRQKDWKEILLNGRLPGREESLFEPLTDTKIYDTAINMSNLK